MSFAELFFDPGWYKLSTSQELHETILCIKTTCTGQSILIAIHFISQLLYYVAR